MEAGQRGWQIDVERVSAGGLLGVRARGLKLETASGLAIPIDDLTASLRLLPLLAGRRSVAFDAHALRRAACGAPRTSPATRGGSWSTSPGVDLARALPLRKASGLDLLGTLTGNGRRHRPRRGRTSARPGASTSP